MHCCCTDSETAPSGAPIMPATPAIRRSSLRRSAAILRWALPITTLAIIPKCPACVAAYVLLFTGIGLSFPAAAAMRWTLIGGCIAAIAYLLARAVRRTLSPPA